MGPGCQLRTRMPPGFTISEPSSMRHTACVQWRWISAALVMAMTLVMMPEAAASAPSLRRSNTNKPARRLTIFGADDRRAVSDSSLYPYSAVGFIRWNDDRQCTASLVGDRFVVTAAECVLAHDGSRRTSSFDQPVFQVGITPGGRKGKKSGTVTTAKVVKIHKQTDFWKKWTQHTYVILELDSDLGKIHGTLSLPTMSDLDQSAGKTAVQFVGFDQDAKDDAKAALKYSKCTCYFPVSFKGPQYMLHHDCDTSPIGSPGSPLLVRYTSMETYIIGVHSNGIGRTTADESPELDQTKAGYSDEDANRGVLGPFIQKHLQSLVASSASGSMPSVSSSGSNGRSSETDTADDSPRPSSVTRTKSPSTTSESPSVRSSSNSGDEDSQNSAQSSTADSRISTSMAYTCIIFVGCAWMAIVFIAVRHLRRPTAHMQTPRA